MNKIQQYNKIPVALTENEFNEFGVLRPHPTFFTSWQIVADLMELKMISKQVDTTEFVWLSENAK
jgi:hypothetical protein